MDSLLKNNTSETHMELDKQDSATFLEFLYPDRHLLSRMESVSTDSKGFHMMDWILKVFQEKKWYGCNQNRMTQMYGWLPLSGCPLLGPKSINNCKVQLEKFLNNVLGVVSKACGLLFL